MIAAVAEGDMLRTQMAIVRRLVKHEPVNVIALAGADRRARAGDRQVRNGVTATLVQAFQVCIHAGEGVMASAALVIHVGITSATEA